MWSCPFVDRPIASRFLGTRPHARRIFEAIICPDIARFSSCYLPCGHHLIRLCVFDIFMGCMIVSCCVTVFIISVFDIDFLLVSVANDNINYRYRKNHIYLAKMTLLSIFFRNTVQLYKRKYSKYVCTHPSSPPIYKRIHPHLTLMSTSERLYWHLLRFMKSS